MFCCRAFRLHAASGKRCQASCILLVLVCIARVPVIRDWNSFFKAALPFMLPMHQQILANVARDMTITPEEAICFTRLLGVQQVAGGDQLLVAGARPAFGSR